MCFFWWLSDFRGLSSNSILIFLPPCPLVLLYISCILSPYPSIVLIFLISKNYFLFSKHSCCCFGTSCACRRLWAVSWFIVENPSPLSAHAAPLPPPPPPRCTDPLQWAPSWSASGRSGIPASRVDQVGGPHLLFCARPNLTHFQRFLAPPIFQLGFWSAACHISAAPRAALTVYFLAFAKSVLEFPKWCCCLFSLRLGKNVFSVCHLWYCGL